MHTMHLEIIVSVTSMVAAPHLILGGDLKISDQNNWGEGGHLSKKLNLGRYLNLRGAMNTVG